MKYFGLLIGLFGCILYVYGLTEGKYIIFNSFILAVNFCVIVFWIKEIFNEKP